MATNKPDPLHEHSRDSVNHAARLHDTSGHKHGVKRKTALRKILRARTRLMVCFCTLPVYMAALWILLSNQHDIDSFMYFYMAMWAGFAVDMASRRCPDCDNQFFVKLILLNLLTRRCVNCGSAQQGDGER